MSNEIDSLLTFEIERETDAGNKVFVSRDCRTYYKDRSGGDKPLFDRGSIHEFRRIGRRIAIVPRYEEGMIQQLNVDAVMEVDGGPPLSEPFIFEQSTQNTDGMSFTGIPSIDAERNRPDQSMESIMFVQGTPFSGPAKAGFIPQEQVYFSLGKTSDGKDVRIKVQDMRPQPPIGVPSISPVPRV